jgi:hypothetical protein
MQAFKKEAHPFNAAITAPSPELARCVVNRTW